MADALNVGFRRMSHAAGTTGVEGRGIIGHAHSYSTFRTL
jgi:hypothetical protein